MNAKHTPGPWFVGEMCNKLIDIMHDVKEPGAISLVLARVTARQTWIAQAEANARLIAAAPDLLEALQECADSLSEAISQEGGNGEDVPEVLNARAAITRATQA